MTTTSKKAIWTGRIISGVIVALLAMDVTIKLMQHPAALQGTAQLGYRTSAVLGIGIVQLVCLIAYLVPATSVFGAILWTGYLGGAVATHLRVGDPLFTHVLSPVYVGVLLWLGLWLRDGRLRALTPLRAPSA